jgi:predicted nucleic acid-binding protein
VIVVDASAALSGLLNAGPAREVMASDQVHAPHLIDAEVASGLRRSVGMRRITPDAGWIALDAWRRLGIVRYALVGMLDRVWELRDNLSAYDASYVALAEALECGLLTADRRLSQAPGVRCTISVVPG